MEEEFVQNQEVLKPQEEKAQEERTKVDELRGSPMGVGTLEERIDENHAIVGSSVGPEYYVTIMSFVDKDLLEPGCSVLLHNKVSIPPRFCSSHRVVLCPIFSSLRSLHATRSQFIIIIIIPSPILSSHLRVMLHARRFCPWWAFCRTKWTPSSA
jgi:hypothetical protein